MSRHQPCFAATIALPDRCPRPCGQCPPPQEGVESDRHDLHILEASAQFATVLHFFQYTAANIFQGYEPSLKPSPTCLTGMVSGIPWSPRLRQPHAPGPVPNLSWQDQTTLPKNPGLRHSNQSLDYQPLSVNRIPQAIPCICDLQIWKHATSIHPTNLSCRTTEKQSPCHCSASNRKSVDTTVEYSIQPVDAEFSPARTAQYAVAETDL